MVQVTSGISSDTHIEVEGDLTPEQEVVSGPFKTLNKLVFDGDRVRINNSTDLGESGQ